VELGLHQCPVDPKVGVYSEHAMDHDIGKIIAVISSLIAISDKIYTYANLFLKKPFCCGTVIGE
jgi:hypothetical protein